MTANLTYLVLVAVLYGTGVYLILERSLTRVLLGLLLLSNATNLLILTASGPAGRPPIVGLAPEDEMSDPLPQAMILTAIVITVGIAAFVLALIYRSWTLDDREDVLDDPEDRRIAAEQDGLDHEADVAAGESPYDTGEDFGRTPVGSVRVEPSQAGQP
jgi:multicomponent Na+:H+ antiporter subunit C